MISEDHEDQLYDKESDSDFLDTKMTWWKLSMSIALIEWDLKFVYRPTDVRNGYWWIPR